MKIAIPLEPAGRPVHPQRAPSLIKLVSTGRFRSQPRTQISIGSPPKWLAFLRYENCRPSTSPSDGSEISFFGRNGREFVRPFWSASAGARQANEKDLSSDGRKFIVCVSQFMAAMAGSERDSRSSSCDIVAACLLAWSVGSRLVSGFEAVSSSWRSLYLCAVCSYQPLAPPSRWWSPELKVQASNCSGHFLRHARQSQCLFPLL